MLNQNQITSLEHDLQAVKVSLQYLGESIKESEHKDEIFNKYLVVLDSYMELLDTMKEDL